MIMNVEQSSFSGVVLNVSRLAGIKKIIGKGDLQYVEIKQHVP